MSFGNIKRCMLKHSFLTLHLHQEKKKHESNVIKKFQHQGKKRQDFWLNRNCQIAADDKISLRPTSILASFLELIMGPLRDWLDLRVFQKCDGKEIYRKKNREK